jgi:small-conductance mechanosensitive channel
VSLNEPIAKLQANLAWAPPWTTSVAVAAVALVLAQILYGLIVRAVRRTPIDKRPFLHSLLIRTREPARLALLLGALSWAAEAAPFPPPQEHVIQHILLIALVVLCGWAALASVDIGAALYTRGLHLDEAGDLLARKHLTQVRILRQAVSILVVVITAGLALMTIPGVRQLGVSLLAAGGAAGIIMGLALQPVLSNLVAGVQIALTQPIRIDDAVFIQNEYGSVEEISATYVVVRLWDQRRLIVPLKYFLDQPFQNWTRQSAERVGQVTFLIDYRIPVAPLREKFEAIVRASKLWDGRVAKLQVTEAREHSLEIRALVSGANPDAVWDLRCEVREKMVDYLRTEFPEALPRNGVEFSPEQVRTIRSLAGSAPGGERVQ